MKTTPDLDDDLIINAKVLAAQQRTSLTRSIEEGLPPRLRAETAAFTLMPMVVVSFLRLLTSARVSHVPAPVGDPVGFVDALLAAAGVHLGALGAEWRRLRRSASSASSVATTCPVHGWPPPPNSSATTWSVSTAI